MALVVPPGFASAAFIFSANDGTEPFVTTLGLDISAAGTNYVSAADNCYASYIDAFQGVMDAGLRLDKVSLFVNDDEGNGSVDSLLGGAQGIRSTDSTPIAMSLIMRKVTASLGRSGRGRCFLPGVLSSVDVGESGNVYPASQTAFETRMSTFHENLLTADPEMALVPVILHSETSPATTPTPIQGFACGPKVGWVRGRIW